MMANSAKLAVVAGRAADSMKERRRHLDRDVNNGRMMILDPQSDSRDLANIAVAEFQKVLQQQNDDT